MDGLDELNFTDFCFWLLVILFSHFPGLLNVTDSFTSFNWLNCQIAMSRNVAYN